jgi:hypothetical protein
VVEVTHYLKTDIHKHPTVLSDVHEAGINRCQHEIAERPAAKLG